MPTKGKEADEVVLTTESETDNSKKKTANDVISILNVKILILITIFMSNRKEENIRRDILFPSVNRCRMK